ncbi:conserved hypothetical protein [Ricinus communis]|uniref:Uncharacterized protein n=1 Tax=Ricinus communis TaxID=3988 RepID=B9TFT0_RICCO|nr:conserved hypothetical protein [Ricinus communis]
MHPVAAKARISKPDIAAIADDDERRQLGGEAGVIRRVGALGRLEGVQHADLRGGHEERRVGRAPAAQRMPFHIPDRVSGHARLCPRPDLGGALVRAARHRGALPDVERNRLQVVDQIADLARAEARAADRQVDGARRVAREHRLAVAVLELPDPRIAQRFERGARGGRVDDICRLRALRSGKNRREVHYWLAAMGADAGVAVPAVGT